MTFCETVNSGNGRKSVVCDGWVRDDVLAVRALPAMKVALSRSFLKLTLSMASIITVSHALAAAV